MGALRPTAIILRMKPRRDKRRVLTRSIRRRSSLCSIGTPCGEFGRALFQVERWQIARAVPERILWQPTIPVVGTVVSGKASETKSLNGYRVSSHGHQPVGESSFIGR